MTYPMEQIRIKGRKNRRMRVLECALADQAAGRLDTASPDGVRRWAEGTLRKAASVR